MAGARKCLLLLYPFPTLVELRLQVHLDLVYVEERVRLEHDPHDAAERQEHPERAAPRVRDEGALPPARDLSPQLDRRRGPGRRARVRFGRTHEPAVTVEAADRGAAAGQRVQFLPLAHFLATGHGRRSPAHVTAHLCTQRTAPALTPTTAWRRALRPRRTCDLILWAPQRRCFRFVRC